MINDLLDYDPQLEIKVINLLFRLESYPPKSIYRKVKEILDFKNRWNIWLLGRNLYHVCYGRPRLIIPMCELASLAHEDIIRLSNDNDKSNIEYEVEWNSALTVSLITENDDFLSCTPSESVFFYGFLCYYKIVDPTLKIEAIEKKFNEYQDSNTIEKEIIIQTLLPLLLSCWSIFKEKFPNFLNSILSFIQNNQNQTNNNFNYSVIYDEIQGFEKSKCDLKLITPFFLLHQTKDELEEQKDLYIKGSERKASLLYQQKKAKESKKSNKPNENDDDLIEIKDDFDNGINDDKIIDDDDETEDKNSNENQNENSNKNEDKNSNENQSENSNKNEDKNSNENQNENSNKNEDKNSNENESNNDSNLKNEQNETKIQSSFSQSCCYLSFSHKLHKIISADDVDSLQQISTHPDFSFDFRVETTLTACYELLMNKPTLIQLSAFYGSIKCFKYLYLNKSSLSLTDLNDEVPNSIASFSILGGNIEIIRILIAAKVDFSSALFTSVSYHRDDLFFWFIENMGIEELNINDKKIEGMTLMHFAAESNNLNIAQFLIESGIDIDFSSNYDEDNIQTPFELACNYDCVGIVELICINYIDKIPKKAILDALSICMASNSADSFSFLIGFTETKRNDGTSPFKLTLEELEDLKKKRNDDGFGESKQESQISKILNDFEKMIMEKQKESTK